MTHPNFRRNRSRRDESNGMTGTPAARTRAVLAVAILSFAASSAHGQWQQQRIDSEASFRGLRVVSAQIAWVSGTKGTFG